MTKGDVDVKSSSAVNDVPVEKTITPIYQIEKRFPTLKSAICSPLFVSLLIWMGLLHLRWTFFIGSFNVWIERLADHDKRQGKHGKCSSSRMS